MKKTLILFLLQIVPIAVFCQPVISSLSVSSGYPGTNITLTGTNFNASAAGNVVYFGATQATVVSASGTSLSVTVPSGATFGPVSVLNTSSTLTGFSQYPFLPDYNNSDFVSGIINFSPKTDFTTGTNPYGVAIGDVDGDGLADVVVANYGSNTISVYRNTSTSGSIISSSFATPVTFTTGTGPTKVVLCDVDGDGKPEIMVTNGGSATVSVFHNVSSSGSITTSSLSTKVDFATGTTPEYAVMGDIDGDGRADLIVANYGSNTVSVFRNTATTGIITTSSFAGGVTFATGTAPYGVAIGDLDGDGKPDLAVTNYSGATISVLHNTASSGSIGSGSFATGVTFATGTNPEGIAIGDFDGDGKQDIAVTNRGSATVSVFRNTATSGTITAASFAAGVAFTTGTNPCGIAIGDFDGDGKPDFAVANYGSNTASVFHNKATSGSITTTSFAAKVDYTTGTAPYVIAAGDLDGDGRADLAVTNYTSGTVSVLWNNALHNIANAGTLCITGTRALVDSSAGGTWTSNATGIATVTTAGVVTGVAAGTATISYAVTGGYTTATVTVSARPTVASITPSTLSTCVGSPITFTAGAVTGPGTISSYNWSGPGGYSTTTNVNANVYTPAVTTASGIYSLTVTYPYPGCTNATPVVTGSVAVNAYPVVTVTPTTALAAAGGPVTLTATGATTYAWTPAASLSASTGAAVTASPTVATTYTVTGTTGICTGTASTSISLIQPPTITNVSPASAVPGSTITITGTNFNTTAANNTVYFGATKATVSAASATSMTVSLPSGSSYKSVSEQNSADGLQALSQFSFLPDYNNSSYISGIINYSPQVGFATDASPVNVCIADIDGDGKPDLITGYSGGTVISVYRNTSTSGSITTGSFAAKVDFTTGSTPYTITVGDADGDGKLDIIAANEASNTVSVLRNTSASGSITAASFATHVDFATGTTPYGVVLSDIDGDGRPEILVANYGSNTLSVLRNTSTSGSITTASFAGKVDFTTGTEPWNIAVQDLDGDGKPDVAVGDYGTTTVSVFRNTATSGSINASSLAAKVDFTAGSEARSLAIGDIDGDGKPDLVVSNQASNTISIFRNTATSGTINAASFATAINFATGSVPLELSLSDMDGDGKLDIAVGCGSGASVSVFRNIATSGSITSGSLATRVDYAAGAGANSATSGDLDGDGRPDIVVANLSANTLSVLWNNPLHTITGAGSLCVGGNLTLADSTIGGTWSSSSTAIATISTGGVVTGIASGSAVITYAVTGGYTTVVVTVNNRPTIAGITSSTSSTCIGSAITLTGGAVTGTGSLSSYNWSGPGGYSTTGTVNTAVFTPTATTASGVYSLTVTYPNPGCTSTVSVTSSVAVNAYPVLTVTPTSATISEGGPQTITASGATNYAWSPATSLSATTGAAVISTPVTSLTYTVVGSNGVCTASATSAISISLPPTITLVSPLSGIPGSNITLTGTNFNTTAANNIVYFGATQATVSAATATSMTVSLPLGATYAPVSELNTGVSLQALSQFSFEPEFNNSIYVSGIINFSPKVNFATTNTPSYGVLADIDGDGKADLVVGYANGAVVSVYHNTSTSGSITTGSFATRVDFTTGSGPYVVAVADMDGDGKPDIVTCNGNSNTVSVLRNTSTSGTIAAGSFATKVDFATGTSPYGMAVRDLDGDGRPEILVTNSASNTLSVFHNTSTSGSITTSSFATQVTFATGTSPYYVAIGDLDGDGKPDVAVADNGTTTVSVFRNTTTAGSITTSSLAAKVDFTTGTGARGVAIGDVDGDGKQDLVVTNQNANTVSILRNTATSGTIATGSFATHVDFTTGTNPITVALSDLDGDGKLDMVIPNWNGAGGTTMSVYRNLSTSGSITTASMSSAVNYTTGTGPVFACIGDIDGDNRPDIAVGNWGAPALSIFWNNPLHPITGAGPICVTGTVTLSDSTTGGTWSSSATGIATVSTGGVVTGIAAGTATISYAVTGGYTTASITVTARPTVASITPSAASTCVGVPLTFTAGAVTGTGTLTSYNWSGPSGYITTSGVNTAVLTPTATANAGFYSVTVTYPNPGCTSIAAVTSPSVVVNANPVLTITPTNAFIPSGGPVTLSITGATTYIWSPATSLSASTGASVVSTSTSNITYTVTGNNGVCSGMTTTTLSIEAPPTITLVSPYSGIPGSSVTITGTNFSPTAANNKVYFGATQATVSAATPTSMTVALPAGATYAPVSELNEDVSLQALSQFSFVPEFNNSNYISGMINYSAQVNFTTDGSPVNVCIADIDGDGKPDLVTGYSAGTAISVYRNISTSGSITTGSFAARVDFTTGSTPYTITVGDADGDGKPDIIAANQGSNTVSVLRNTSTSGSITAGSFATKVDFTTGTNPYGVILSDMDGDGRPEILVANYGSNTLSVLRNTSTSGSITSGSFATKVDFTTGSEPWNIAVEDLDGDGKPDVAVGDYGTTTVSIFRNTATAGVINSSSLAAKVDFTAGSGARSVAIGDIDGDGKPDLVVSNQTAATISILRNTATSGTISSGSFATAINFATGAGPINLALADMDGDGKLDIALGCGGGSSVSVFRNIATSGSITTGSLATRVDYTAGSAANSITIGDLDGDNRPDMVTANYTGNTLSVFWNNPLHAITGAGPICVTGTLPLSDSTIGGTWSSSSTAIATVSTGGVVTGIAAGNTVITYSVTGGYTTASVTVNNRPTVASITSSTSSTCIGSPVTLTAGAVTGTGSLISYNWSGPVGYSTSGAVNTAVFTPTATTASGAYSLTVTYPNPGCTSTVSVTTPSVTVNAYPVLTVTPSAVSIAEGGPVTITAAGATTYVWSPVTSLSASTGTSVTSTALANITYTVIGTTGVCRDTAISAISIEPIPTITSVSPVSGIPGSSVTITGSSFSPTAANNIVYFGATQAVVSSATTTSMTVTLPAGATYAPVSELNEDISLQALSQFSFMPEYNNSAYIAGIINYSPKVDFTTGTSPVGVVVSDVDGDGKPDLIVANETGNTVSVFRNTSASGSITAGSFATAVSFTTGSNPYGVTVGDVDGDGKPDIIATNFGSNTVSVLRNTSTSGSITTSSFATKVDFTTGTSPYGVALSDIDGDGRPEILVANEASSTVSVLRNTSVSGSITSSSFAVKVDFTTGTNPYNLAVGDIDGDGKPDLAVANYTSSTVSVLRNTSAIGSITGSSFATKVDFATGTNARSVAIGDLDGDGKPDLTIANQGAATVSVLRNTATSGSITSASFSTHIDFTTGTTPLFVAIGDMDGDGKPDLAVSNQGSNTMSVLRNISTSGSISTGSFAAKVDYTTGTGSRGLAVGDLDGDGRPEIITSNFGSNTLSVFWNNPLYVITGAGSLCVSGVLPLNDNTAGGTWSSSATTIAAISTGGIVTGIAPGNAVITYSVTGGFTTASVTVTARPTVASITSSTSSTCIGSPVTLTAGVVTGTGSLTSYNWNGPAGYSTTSGVNTSVFTPTATTASGIYSLTVTYPNPGCTSTVSVTTPSVTVNAYPVMTVTPTAITIAIGGPTTLAASGGTVYAWSPAASLSASTGASVTAIPTVSTTYTVVGSNGVCSTSATSVVSISQPPVITGVTPNKDSMGMALTILGNYFNTAAANDVVYFGSVKATVTSASTTSMTVTVPSGGLYGPITELNLGNNLMGAQQDSSFLPTYNNSIFIPGGINFLPAVDFTTGTGTNSYGVSIADIDGDGKPDVIVSNEATATISVFRNTSASGSITSSSFAAPVTFATGTEPEGEIGIGDIDGDGKPDIAVANWTTGTISVFRNTATSGSITTSSLAAAVTFTAGTNPWGVELKDIDGDGRPDMIVTNEGSATLYIYRNTATTGSITTSSFAAPVSYATGTGPWDVHVNDIDGDGKPDIAVANNGSNTVSVFRNTATAGSISSSSLATAVNFTTGTGPYGVLLRDVDGDGKSDMLVTNYTSNTLYVYRNTASSGSITSSSFATPASFATGAGPALIAMGDFDGDGKPDVAVTNEGAGTLSIFRNTAISGTISSSSLATPFSAAIGAGASWQPAVAVGDIDGDGRPDLVATDYTTYFSVLWNNPLRVITGAGPICVSGTLPLSDSTAGGTWSSSATTIATISTGGVVTGIAPGNAVITYSVTGGFTTASVTVNARPTVAGITSSTSSTCIGSPVTLTAGAIAGTGTLTSYNWSGPAAYSTTTGINTAVFTPTVTTASGIYSLTVTYPNPGCTSTVSVTTPSVTVNAYPVLTVTPTSVTIGIGGPVTITAAGATTYAWSPVTSLSASTGASVTSTALANITYTVIGTTGVCKDTATSVVSINLPPTITAVSPASAIPGGSITITGTNFNTTAANNIVYFGATQATVSAANATSMTVSLPSGANYAPVSEVNTGDGLQALAQFSFMPEFNNSNYVAGMINYNPKVDYTTDGSPATVSIVDVDGDGKPDLVVGSQGSAVVSVYRNTSTSGSITATSFAAKVDFATGSVTYCMITGDVDGDGQPDIIVTNESSNTVSVLRNTATSGSITATSFATHVDFATGTTPMGVALSDLDGDGRTDIIVADEGANTVSVLHNTGTSGSMTASSFAAKVDFTVGTNPWYVIAGDVDGDGQPEIISSGYGANTVSVLRNTATAGSITTGSFAAKVDFAASTNPRGLALADIDGDGKPDLTVTNFGVSTIYVYRNTAVSGSITTSSFATPVSITVGSGPYNVAVGDMDGDGKPDLAVSNFNSNTLSVLRNTATSGSITTGSFGAAVSYTGDTNPYGVAIGDLDGDNRPDIAMSNFGSATVSVYWNNPLHVITGAGSLCIAGTLPLSDSTTGGTWSSSATTIAAISTAGVVTGIAAGTATITYAVTGGYTTASVTVNARPAVAGITSSTSSTCIGSPVTLTAGTVTGTGSLTSYNWNGPAGYTTTTGVNTAVFTPTATTASGIYSLTVTYPNPGCTSTVSVTTPSVTVNAYPVLTVTPVSAVIASGGPITITAAGATTYAWSPITSLSASTGASVTSTATANITYTVIGTTGVCKDTATSIISQNQPPTITSVSPLSGMPGAAITITGTNFSPTAANNTVYFGATQAIVSSATTTSMTVTLPVSATYALVSELNEDVSLQALSQFSFLPEYNNSAYISGMINYKAKVDFTTDGGPVNACIADMDGDGKPDLVVAYNTTNVVSVFRNISTSGSITASSFAAKIDFTTGTTPYSITVGDVDGDGKPDIIATNVGSNTVSVFHNTSTSGSITTSSFAAKVDFITGSSPYGVALSDIDGDGRPEMLVANSASNTLSVFHNTGTSGSITSSTFAAKVDFTTGTTPYNIAVADLDGDGKPDVAIADEGTSTVSILRNTATPGSITSSTFAAKVDFTTGSGARGVAIGDLDGDGKPDLAVTNQTSGTISILRNTATSGSITSASFSTHIDFTTGTTPVLVAIGDMDGDGKPDLAVDNYGSATMSVFRNLSTIGSISSGSFATKVDYTTGTNPNGVALGDLDGDGRPDLVTGNYGSNTFSIFWNNPLHTINGAGTMCVTGSLALTDSTAGGTWSSSSTAIATISTGGVVTGLASGSTIITYSVTGGYTTATVNVNNRPTVAGITPSSINVCTGNTLTLTAGAVTGTGTLVSYNWRGPNGYSTTGTAITAAFVPTTTASGGIYSLTVTYPYTGCTSAVSVTSPSVTVNTTPTVTVSPSAASIANGGPLTLTAAGGTTYVWSPAASLSASTGATVISTAGASTNYTVTGTTGLCSSIAISTVTVNAPPTITAVTPATAYPGSSIIITGTNFNTTPANNIVYFGATQATVSAATATSMTVSMPVGATYASVTELNAGVNLGAYSQYSFLPDFNNSPYIAGIINFSPKVDLTADTGPTNITIADMDGDGKADLVVAYTNTNVVSIYRNISASGSITSGSFATNVDFTTGTNPYGVAVGDVDGDGKPDIIVTNNGSNTVSVFRNTSTSGSITTGSFAAKVDFTTGSQPYGAALSDVDGDGRPEMLVTNYASATVSVFHNTGTSGSISASSFAAKVDFATGTNPYNIVVADFDGDGKRDIAIANYLSNTVSVLRNTATTGVINTSTFAAKVDFTTGTQPRGIAAGDLDGDGKPDLAVTNEGSNSVSVFRNTATSGSITASSFAAKVDFTSGTQPLTVAIGDLDGDGKPDLAVASNVGTAASVFRNTSTSGSITASSFSTKVDYATGAYPNSVTIGDLDGDGKPDLAVSNNTSNTVSIFRNTMLSPITGTGVVCTGSSLALSDSTASGAWSTSATSVATISTGGVLTGIGAGTVTVTYSVTGGYTTATVTVTTGPAISLVTSSTANICVGGSMTLTATESGGGSGPVYTWNGPGIATTTSSASASVFTPSTSVTATGAYSVFVTFSGTGCTSAVALSSSVTVSPQPSVSLTALPSALCSGGSETLTATPSNGAGTATYTWRGPGIATTIGSTPTPVFTPTVATAITGTYSLSLSYSGTGCNVATATSAPVTISSQALVSLVSSSTAICSGGTTTLTATPSGGSGSPVYTWSGPGIAVTTGASPSAVFAPTAAATATGAYTVSVAYSGGGCSTASGSSAVDTIAPQPVVTVTVSSSSLCDGLTDTLTAAALTPGAGTASYTWSGPGISGTAGPYASSVYTVQPSGSTSAGSYSVSVRYSGSGCNVAAASTDTVSFAYQQWLGIVSNLWSQPANWACGFVPVITQDITIDPSVYVFAPTLDVAFGYTHSLNILSAAELTLSSGNQLQVAGNLTNNTAITGEGAVYLNGSAPQVLSGTGTISNLTLANTAGAAIDTSADTVGITGTLLLNSGTLTTEGSLELISTAAGDGVIGTITGGAISGNVVIQQYVPGDRRAFRFVAHPYTTSISLNQIQNYIDITGPGGAANSFTPTISNAPSAYWYNPLYGNSTLGSDPGWRNISSLNGTADSNLLHQYEGLRLMIRGSKGEGLTGASYTIDPVTYITYGTVNTGAQSIPLVKGSSLYQDYNLIGNPYPAVTDIGTAINSAYTSGLLVGGVFYLWDPYMSTNGQFVGVTIGSPYYLGPNESFEVRTAVNGNTLNFTESNKGTTVSAQLMRNASEDNLTLYIYDSSYHPWDVLNLSFNDNATDNDDNKYDGDKPSSPAPLNFYSFSADGKKLLYDARPFAAGKVIPLGLTSSYAQQFIIKAQNVAVPAGGKVYLHDKYLGTYTFMSQGAEYKFFITKDPASQGDSRFELGLNPDLANASATKGLDVQMMPNPATSEVTISYNASSKEKTIVRVMDIEGVTVMTQDLGIQQSGSATISLDNLASGIYLVEFTSGTDKVVHRLVKE